MIGKHGRKIRRYNSITPSADIPDDLKETYEDLIKDFEDEEVDQFDFIDHNRKMVENPLNVRLSASARDMFEFRYSARNPRNYGQFY